MNASLIKLCTAGGCVAVAVEFLHGISLLASAVAAVCAAIVGVEHVRRMRELRRKREEAARLDHLGQGE